MMNRGFCALKRNIPVLLEHPGDKNLLYLKEHIDGCAICHEQYFVDLNRRKALENWIPKDTPSTEFLENIRGRMPKFSREFALIIDEKKPRKEFLLASLRDFSSIFKTKSFFILACFLILYIFLNF